MLLLDDPAACENGVLSVGLFLAYCCTSFRLGHVFTYDDYESSALLALNYSYTQRQSIHTQFPLIISTHRQAAVYIPQSSPP